MHSLAECQRHKVQSESLFDSGLMSHAQHAQSATCIWADWDPQGVAWRVHLHWASHGGLRGLWRWMLPEKRVEEQLSWETHLLTWVLLVHEYRSEFLPPHLQDRWWALTDLLTDRHVMRSLRADMLDC